MATQATDNVNSETTGNDGLLTYPIHKVVSIFESPADLEAAVADLGANGFFSDDIETFCGIEGSEPRVFEGAKKGVWASIVHAVQHVGPERTYVERYEKALAEGHCLLMVKVEKEDRKQKAAEILHAHTRERVTYFGLTMADEIKDHAADEIPDKPTHW